MKTKEAEHKQTDEYLQFLETFAAFNSASLTLAGIEHEANERLAELFAESEKQYVEAKAAVKNLEAFLIAALQRHPEWMEGKKSLAVMHGSIASRETNKLAVANEARTVGLIRATFPTTAEQFLHIEMRPNLEALEAMSDEELFRLEILREKQTVWKAKPAKAPLGDVSKDGSKKEGDAKGANDAKGGAK